MNRWLKSLPVDAAIFRIFPHPAVSVIVAIAWLMLQHSLSLAHIIFALFWAWLIPQLTQNFIIRTPNIDWWASIRLVGVVLWDIVISNIRVARAILGTPDALKPMWFRVPLDTNHQQVNALLAMIITTTPGTVSAGIDDERGDILVHSLNATQNADDEIVHIKQRYEQPLIKIFSATPAQYWRPTDDLPPPDAPLAAHKDNA